jgi:flavin reductase (DIM6/NTAB) family NADH-FMN oxidoreductase RutF
MVSVAGSDGGEPDIVTPAWAGTVCSAPPMLSISLQSASHAYELLQHRHEFVVNVPRVSQVRAVDLCGIVAERDFGKFATCGFHALAGARVAAPLIEECPINIECATRHRLSLGAHDLLIGEILAVHYDEELLDSRGRLLPAKVEALAYLHGEYWSLGVKLGSHGFTRKQSRREAIG